LRGVGGGAGIVFWALKDDAMSAAGCAHLDPLVRHVLLPCRRENRFIDITFFIIFIYNVGDFRE